MTSQVTNYQCQSCIGPLRFVGTSGKLECNYCGQVPTGAWVSIRIYYQEIMDDTALDELEVIFASISFE